MLYQPGCDTLHRFENECRILERLHHPNIVQFLGVFYEEDHELPILLMEYLPISLSNCIDGLSDGQSRCIGGRILPNALAYSILRDVALGLCYLHDYQPEPIIHRDLTANNILLTSDMTAKIADLGVARILNLPRHHKMTTGPGNAEYMPPEAREHKPEYSTEIDIFSYGVLILYIFSGTFPASESPTLDNPDHPDDVIGLREVQRREKYLEKMGHRHPLNKLTKKCLHNKALSRPKTYEVLEEVEVLLSRNPVDIENKILAVKIVAELTSKLDKNKQIAERSVRVDSMYLRQDLQSYTSSSGMQSSTSTGVSLFMNVSSTHTHTHMHAHTMWQ